MPSGLKIAQWMLALGVVTNNRGTVTPSHLREHNQWVPEVVPDRAYLRTLLRFPRSVGKSTDDHYSKILRANLGECAGDWIWFTIEDT